MTRDFFATVPPEFAVFTILVWAFTGAVLCGGLAILWFELRPFARAWIHAAFGPEPVQPIAPTNLATFKPRTPQPFGKSAAQGFNRRKFDAIVGGRRS